MTSAVVPRWAVTPGSPATHHFPLPAGLADGVARLATGLGVTPGAVWLACHAKVLGVLGGERRVCVGCRDGDAAPVPRAVDLTAPTWRRLITDTAPSVAGMPYETIVDTTGGGELAGALLAVGPARPDGLRLLVDPEFVDTAYATRIAGYQVTALRLATADPDAEHDRQSLVGAAELRVQLDEFAGPRRRLPDRRAHELVEAWALRTPDAIAAECGPARLTYRELDQRANRMAHALVRAGLRGEDVVAVVTERNLDWLTALLGVLKAGGAYLPVEPGFPATRITTMLRRAGCRLVLTDPAGAVAAEPVLAALPSIRARSIAELADGPGPAGPPDVTVHSGQLAYLYFTSGSTGEPKGAMCEQAGMLNHLLAKIDDLGIDARTRVAQTAPQCFDISLWQLLAPLLAGGTTVLVPQDVLLDIGAFAEELERSGVHVLQVVPSYLDLLLTELGRRHRALPALRRVSVTGEPLRFELVRRWFAAYPDVPLVNAYGLTETSDDTNHEVMDAAPADRRVLLGRPIPGARVYVVDANLVPVPLGAPGEIVFAGVCVGRGYVNDPERTAAAFGDDPHRPGQRLYRSGDFGRWTQAGKLEFLGRRDSQVKIHGFRVEIEEIENQLLRLPEVREAAVVATGAAADQALTACYAAAPSVPVADLRAALHDVLPDYLVPAHFVWLDTLPLTGNGKIDRRELGRVAESFAGADPTGGPPRTAAERELAAAWADVLAVAPESIGRSDDFFQRGGTSLSALRLVIALDRRLSLGDLTGRPVLTDLAELLAGDTAAPGGCLRRLSPPDEPAHAVLVGFPYAGGNAVNYLPLVDALRGSGIVVYGVELPGRGPADDFVGIDAVADRVAAEISALGELPVLLWGHSAGAAAALATERRLGTVRRVFIGAQQPGTAAQRRAAISELAGIDDAELLAGLAAEGGAAELGALSGAHATALAAAYRHDSTAACEFFAALRDAGSPAIAAPVTVVLARDDPGLLDGDWSEFATDVDTCELADGGHYFLATRPDAVAELVGAALRENGQVSTT